MLFLAMFEGKPCTHTSPLFTCTHIIYHPRTLFTFLPATFNTRRYSDTPQICRTAEHPETIATALQGDLTRTRTLLGPYRRPMPRVLGGSLGDGHFLIGEVPLDLPLPEAGP